MKYSIYLTTILIYLGSYNYILAQKFDKSSKIIEENWVKIIRPSLGDTIIGGETLTIELEIEKDRIHFPVLIITPFFTRVIRSPVSIVNVKVPKEVIGEQTIVIALKDSISGNISMSSTKVWVKDENIEWEEIRFMNGRIYMFNSMQEYYTNLIITSKIGVDYSITNMAHLSTVNPEIATVNEKGVIRSHKLGDTFLIGSYRGLSDTVEIKVSSIKGDYNSDGDYNELDFIELMKCKDRQASHRVSSAQCRNVFDYDNDGQIKQEDFEKFYSKYQGANSDCNDNSRIDILEIFGDMKLDQNFNAKLDLCEN